MSHLSLLFDLSATKDHIIGTMTEELRFQRRNQVFNKRFEKTSGGSPSSSTFNEVLYALRPFRLLRNGGKMGEEVHVC